MAQLSDQVGLSPTPAWKRVQKLEAAGVIARRVALLAPERVSVGLSVFVGVEAAEHSPDWLARFAAAASVMPEVMEAMSHAGDALRHSFITRPQVRLSREEERTGCILKPCLGVGALLPPEA